MKIYVGRSAHKARLGITDEGLGDQAEFDQINSTVVVVQDDKIRRTTIIRHTKIKPGQGIV